jgi:hypothetical protein
MESDQKMPVALERDAWEIAYRSGLNLRLQGLFVRSDA